MPLASAMSCILASSKASPNDEAAAVSFSASGFGISRVATDLAAMLIRSPWLGRRIQTLRTGCDRRQLDATVTHSCTRWAVYTAPIGLGADARRRMRRLLRCVAP